MSSFIDIQQSLDIGKEEIGVSWTGQAGFAFKNSAGFVYHIDPYFSNICSQTIGYHRMVPPPVKAKNVIADVIFVTHNHKDHLDSESVLEIAKANPELSFIGPPSCISSFLELGISAERLITIRRGEEKKLGNTVIKAVLAYHLDDSIGYIIHFDDAASFYITGDTTYSDNLISIKDSNPDVIMPCINGRLGCMNIADAARLVGHIQPRYAIPMHYGMFKENTADPKEFVRQAEAYSGITEGIILKPGKWFLFHKDRGFIEQEK